MPSKKAEQLARQIVDVIGLEEIPIIVMERIASLIDDGVEKLVEIAGSRAYTWQEIDAFLNGWRK